MISGRYTGIAGLRLNTDAFELGEGILLSKTYAHMVSKPRITFTPLQVERILVLGNL